MNKLSTPEEADEYGHLQTGRSRAALHGLFWSGLDAGVPTVTALIVFTVTSRFLLPEQFGLVALAGSIVTLASALAPAGFGDALVQYGPVGKRHLDTVFWICTAAAAFSYAVLLAVSWPLSRLLNQPELFPVLAVLGTRLILDLVGTVPNALLSRSMAFKSVASRTAVASLASAAACFLLLYLGFGLWALVLSQLVAAIASCTTSILSVKWRPGLRVDRAAYLELRRFGMFSSANRFVNLLAVDQLLIGGLLGTTALGLYGFARRLFQTIIQLISGAVGAVSNSLLASLQQEKEKLRQVFKIATFACASLSFPLFIGLAAVASDFVPMMFGKQWIDAIGALQGFCVIGIISCIGVLQASLINSQGRADWWLYYQIFQQTATLLVILATYRFGVTTLVLAIAIKSVLTWPATVVVTIRLLRIDWLTYLKPFLPALVSSVIMLGGVLGLHTVLSTRSPILCLIAEVAGGAGLYAASLGILAKKHLLEIWVIIKTRIK